MLGEGHSTQITVILKHPLEKKSEHFKAKYVFLISFALLQ